MPMDMPPGAHAVGRGADRIVEYRMPASAASGIADWVGAARAQDRQAVEGALFARNGDASLIGRPSTLDAARAAVLPALDRGSRAMSREEGAALASVRRASVAGVAHELGVVMPSGYVAERVRLHLQGARLEQAGVEPMSSKAYVCSLARVAADRRAGAYVEGGEAAAARARAAVPDRWSRGCPEGGLAVQAAAVARRDPVSVSPASSSTSRPVPSRSAAAHAAVEPNGMARVSIEPKGAARVSIAPKGSARVSIDPVGSKRMRLDLGSLSKGPARGADLASRLLSAGRGRES